MLFIAVEPPLNTADNFFVNKFIYAAPLSLFPLMAFFLWFDYKKYKPFVYLYVAGKIASVCAVITSFFSLLKELFSVLWFLDTKKIITNMIIPVFTFLDLLFVILVIFLSNHKKNKNSLELSICQN
jgi:hypothetical protein